MFTEATNASRAKWAQAALDTFASQTNMDKAGEETGTILGDLLANLMHLSHQQGLDFSVLLDTARGNFETELTEEDKELPAWALLAAPGEKKAVNPDGPRETQTCNAAAKAPPTPPAKEIVIRVDADYVPDDGDAFEAVQCALEHFSIPTVMIERTIAPARVVIGLEGGVIQGATASVPTEFLVYDYDVQDAATDEVAVRPALDGKTVAVLKSTSRDAVVDAAAVTIVFDAAATAEAAA
ncbi:hypothetical protein [Duganella vulcania]|uniref:Uncharacterized protein n=1 Tax=Duganella vulcania TaxID=2692166 RepID=A0A845GHJ0_9BURK|nr:hypothetical protein [Duganella vulcania]MYM92498.1 hypothetical protein [Duganella vulcania]